VARDGASGRSSMTFSNSRRYQRVLQGFLSRLAARVAREQALVWNPYLSAKFFPLEREPAFRLGSNGVVQALAEPSTDPGGSLPIPPQDLWEGWSDTVEAYLRTGRNDMQFVLDSLAEAGGGGAGGTPPPPPAFPRGPFSPH